MINRFSSGLGGTYSHQVLNDAVHGNPNYETFFRVQINNIQNVAGGITIDNLKNYPKMILNRFSFPTISPDIINGLVIAIHQVWAAKIELKNVTVNNTTKTGKGVLVFTMYDHFGLDAADIVKFGNYPILGEGFIAWYILQHYRNAKPFVTEIKISYPIQIKF